MFLSILIDGSNGLRLGFVPGKVGPRCQLGMSSVSESRAQSINIQLDGVKNMRDMTTASNKILSTRVIRTGCVSKSSDKDIEFMCKNIGFKTLVDLRSPREIVEDEEISGKVYDGFCDFQYSPKKKMFIIKNKSDIINTDGTRRRYFVSLMSESLIKKGVFMRFRKRIRFKAASFFMLSLLSRRAEKKVRSIFIDTINGGGLSLLNELVVDASGDEIMQVLKLTADKDNYPIALYCTAGKDRTGLVSMLILSVLGATDEEILADYVLSDSAYKEIGDNKAMVAALQQTDVDPETFLRAIPQVMTDTMEYIRDNFGSINGFLDQYGFDEGWRTKLRDNLTQE